MSSRPVHANAELARWRRGAIGAASLGLVASLVWTWSTVTPSENLARLRNSLGAEVGTAADFVWDPASPPADFLRLLGPVPAEFAAVVQDLEARTDGGGSGEFEFALAVARDLMRAPSRIDTPIRDSSFETYQAIVGDGRGYCADFVKVFGGMALARGMPVRQWGFAFDGFGSGHTFNEIYDTARRKWVLVDSFHSIYFVDSDSRTPLSVIEVHDRLLGIDDARPNIAIVRISPETVPFRTDELALDYYRRGMSQLWLVWGNNTFDYESSVAGQLESRVHRALGQLLGIANGTYPTIRIYPTGMSRRDYRMLTESRTEFFFAVLFLSLSLLCAAWVAANSFLARRSDRR